MLFRSIDKVTYSLYEVYYKGAVGNTDIYDSTATFYAIVPSDTTSTISVVNYSSILTGDITHVYVPYNADNINNNATDDESDDFFKLTGAIIKYVYMDATGAIQSKTIPYEDDAIQINLSEFKDDASDNGYIEKKYVITLNGENITSIENYTQGATLNNNQRLIVVWWDKP